MFGPAPVRWVIEKVSLAEVDGSGKETGRRGAVIARAQLDAFD